MSRVVLIDGTAIAYRAFFAIPSSFQTSGGIPTNATFGFAKMLHKLFGKKRPPHCAIAFDLPGPTFRSERYSDYKAQRPSMPSELRQQLPWIHRLIEAHGIKNVSARGYEADDVIGTLSAQAREAGHEVMIVSGDKDFAQLIDAQVRMWDPVKEVMYDAELVRKKWGVTPERFVDYLALTGDKADNIPGIAGIGPKTAKRLLDDYGDLEAVLAHAEDERGKLKERLLEHADVARLSRELATIEQDVPLQITIEELATTPIEPKVVDALFEELEFYSLLSQDRAGDLQAHPTTLITDLQAWQREGSSKESEGADALIALHPVIEDDAIVALGLFDGEREACLLPSTERPPALNKRPSDTALRAWLDGDTPKVVHDLRRALVALSPASSGSQGTALHAVVGDVQLGSYLLDPTVALPHRLDQITRLFLQRPLVPLAELLKAKGVRSAAALPKEALASFAGQQARAIWESWQVIQPRLREADQEDYLAEIAIPLARVLAEMQRVGVRVSQAQLQALSLEFEARRDEIAQAIFAEVGHELNLGSPKQLGAVLFEELGLPVIKKTKTGYSTSAEVLEALESQHPVPKLVLRWRSLKKLINTYTRVLSEAISPSTGRIHCTFEQTTSASGRLISTQPDLQRTPIRSEDGKRIREAFIAREGWRFLSADWNQIELRILAHYSQDPALIAAFSEGLDIHRQTAARLYRCRPEEIDAAQRNVGKTMNFATIYGQGATALAQQLGVSRAEAKERIAHYFEVYQGVDAWLTQTRADAYRDGFVTTLFGRKRLIPELTSNNFADRAYGERIATNTPIQGSAADLCKLAMLDIAKAISEMQAVMMVQIHDELLFECPPEEERALKAIVREKMQGVFELDVPLVVEIGAGDSWAAAH